MSSKYLEIPTWYHQRQFSWFRKHKEFMELWSFYHYNMYSKSQTKFSDISNSNSSRNFQRLIWWWSKIVMVDFFCCASSSTSKLSIEPLRIFKLIRDHYENACQKIVTLSLIRIFCVLFTKAELFCVRLKCHESLASI